MSSMATLTFDRSDLDGETEFMLSIKGRDFNNIINDVSEFLFKLNRNEDYRFHSTIKEKLLNSGIEDAVIRQVIDETMQYIVDQVVDIKHMHNFVDYIL